MSAEPEPKGGGPASKRTVEQVAAPYLGHGVTREAGVCYLAAVVICQATGTLRPYGVLVQGWKVRR